MMTEEDCDLLIKNNEIMKKLESCLKKEMPINILLLKRLMVPLIIWIPM